MDPMLLSIAAFIAVAALVGAVAFLMNDFGASRAEERLNEITGRGGRGDGEGVLRQEIMREGMEGALGMFSGLAERLQSLALLFEQSNSPIKPATFFGISLGAAVLGLVTMVGGPAAAALLAGPAVHRRHPRARRRGVRVLPGGVGGRDRPLRGHRRLRRRRGSRVEHPDGLVRITSAGYGECERRGGIV